MCNLIGKITLIILNIHIFSAFKRIIFYLCDVKENQIDDTDRYYKQILPGE